MDPTTAIWVTGAWITFFGAIVVALVNRAGKGKTKSWNGAERRREFKAELDDHIIHCPNITRMELTMEKGFGELKAEIHALSALLETHRNMAHK